MRYLDRRKTAGPSLAPVLAYISVPAGNLPTAFLFVKVFLEDGQIGHISTIAGVGTAAGLNRDHFHSRGSQERLTSLTSAQGTTVPNIFKLARAVFCVLTLASLVWVVGPSSTSRRTLGSLSSGAKMVMKIFVKRVFTIFATNASLLRVIANLQI